MGRFVIRRLFQAVLTVLGVMLLTYLLFRVIAGDVTATFVNTKLGPEARQAWLERRGLDKPSKLFHPDAGWEFWTGKFYDTQFFHHMSETLTFSGRSYNTDETLIKIIRKRAKYSLAITVPAMGLGFAFALIISSIVAYFRGTWIDKTGVFLSILGMCIPFLGYMLLGQWVMFNIYPQGAWGLRNRANIYVPVAIAVIAGIGGSVRFYRTVILDQVNQDYVRTARAKGVALPGVLFKHVMRNCMLPILTQVVLAIPFLIMGSLLLEQFFGIPGLGDLMISSITNRDVPIITGLTFLTAIIYVVGYLITDILYAVFDPRIRLQ